MTKKWWVGFALAASLVLWGTLLVLAAQYAHADQFPAVTITQSQTTTNSTMRDYTIEPSVTGAPVFSSDELFCDGDDWKTNAACPHPSNITTSTFDPTPFILAGVLGAVAAIATFIRLRKYTKK